MCILKLTHACYCDVRPRTAKVLLHSEPGADNRVCHVVDSTVPPHPCRHAAGTNGSNCPYNGCCHLVRTEFRCFCLLGQPHRPVRTCAHYRESHHYEPNLAGRGIRLPYLDRFGPAGAAEGGSHLPVWRADDLFSWDEGLVVQAQYDSSRPEVVAQRFCEWEMVAAARAVATSAGADYVNLRRVLGDFEAACRGDGEPDAGGGVGDGNAAVVELGRQLWAMVAQQERTLDRAAEALARAVDEQETMKRGLLRLGENLPASATRAITYRDRHDQLWNIRDLLGLTFPPWRENTL